MEAALAHRRLFVVRRAVHRHMLLLGRTLFKFSRISQDMAIKFYFLAFHIAISQHLLVVLQTALRMLSLFRLP